MTSGRGGASESEVEVGEGEEEVDGTPDVVTVEAVPNLSEPPDPQPKRKSIVRSEMPMTSSSAGLPVLVPLIAGPPGLSPA